MPTHHKNVKGILACLLCVVLSACAGTATVPPLTQTPQIIVTITPEKATLTNHPTKLQQSSTTPSPTPQGSATFIYSIESLRTPSATPGPSVTPAPSFQTITAFLNSQATLTEQAFELRTNPNAGFSITCDDFQQNNTSLSPSGNWLAISCGYSHDQTLEIASREGKKWVLQFKNFLPQESIQDGATPMGGLFPRQWTNDEKYLYFTSYIGFDGGGTCFYGYGDAGLFRINLNDGTISTILPAISSPEGYEITFSPGGRRLAYNADHLVIVDLKTGDKFTIATGDDWIGGLTWSPDGSQLAYATCHAIKVQTDYENDYQVGNSSIKIFTLDSHTLKTILEVEQAMLRIDRQNGNQVLDILKYDLQDNIIDYFLFDWSSGQLTAVTPTPKPK
jgi:WD40 repeat protein